MRPHRRPRGRSGLCLLKMLLLLGLAASGRGAEAHGGPEKVVDDRFVVTAALVPAGDATLLRFFFRDFRSGRRSKEALSFRVRILDDRSEAVVCESPVGSVRDGWAQVLCRFSAAGFHEVFLQFWVDGELTRVYEPEDWRVWVGEAEGSGTWVSRVVIGAAAVTIAMIGVSTWRRRTDGRHDT
jgi:hypothetical protein